MGERQDMETASSSASHLIFPTVFGLFTTGNWWQVHSLYSGSNQCQIRSSRQDSETLLTLKATRRPRLTTAWDHVSTNLFPSCEWHTRVCPVFFLIFCPPPFLFCFFGMPSSVHGGPVTVKGQEPHWRPLDLPRSALPLIASAVSVVLALMSGCWYPRQQIWPPADSTLSHAPQKNTHPTVSLTPQQLFLPKPGVLPTHPLCKPFLRLLAFTL